MCDGDNVRLVKAILFVGSKAREKDSENNMLKVIDVQGDKYAGFVILEANDLTNGMGLGDEIEQRMYHARMFLESCGRIPSTYLFTVDE